MRNSEKIILDLCGGTGSWSKPYRDAGYDEVYDMVTDSRNCTDFWEAVSEMYEGDW